jgi:hypothetical protein
MAPSFLKIKNDLKKTRFEPVLFIKTKLIPSDPLKIEDTGKS